MSIRSRQHAAPRVLAVERARLAEYRFGLDPTVQAHRSLEVPDAGPPQLETTARTGNYDWKLPFKLETKLVGNRSAVSCSRSWTKSRPFVVVDHSRAAKSYTDPPARHPKQKKVPSG